MQELTVISDVSFKGLLIALAIAALRYLVPVLIEYLEQLEAQRLDTLTATAVRAAESYYVGAGRGKEKLQFALGYLERQGAKSDEILISAKSEELYGGRR